MQSVYHLPSKMWWNPSLPYFVAHSDSYSLLHLWWISYIVETNPECSVRQWDKNQTMTLTKKGSGLGPATMLTLWWISFKNISLSECSLYLYSSAGNGRLSLSGSRQHLEETLFIWESRLPRAAVQIWVNTNTYDTLRDGPFPPYMTMRCGVKWDCNSLV